MKSRARSKCWQKVTNKDWRESFQGLDRITALVPGKPEVVLFSFSFTSAIRFLRAYGGHIAMYSRACAVALSAISGHEWRWSKYSLTVQKFFVHLAKIKQRLNRIWYKETFIAKIIFLYNSIFTFLKVHWLSRSNS